MRDEYGYERRDVGALEIVSIIVSFALCLPIYFACADGLQGFGLGVDAAAFIAGAPTLALFLCLSYLGQKLIDAYRVRYRGWHR